MRISLKARWLVSSCTTVFLLWTLNQIAFAQSLPSPGSTDSGASQCLPTEDILDAAIKVNGRCPRQWTKVEEHVIELIAAGRTADLRKGTLEERTLSGCFVSELLTINSRVPAAGVDIRNAIIVGPVDLRNQEIKHGADFANCEFQDVVDLKRSHFTRRLFFKDCTFRSRMDAESAIIDFELVFDNCTFDHCLTFFKSLHIGGDLWLNNTKFKGEADFTETEVKGDFMANQVEFHQAEADQTRVNPTQAAADFDSMKVSGATEMTDALFYGYVGFGDGHFGNIFLNGSKFFGNTSFMRTKLDGLFLDNANFLAANNPNQQLTIDEMTFQDMSPSSWDKLKDFASATAYKPEFYSNLEALFLRHQYPDQATAVFIAGQQRQRDELWSKVKAEKALKAKTAFAIEWFANLAFDKLLGYGRHKERVLIVSAVILLLGWFFAFRKEDWMKPQNPDDNDYLKGKYRGFWYSLDLFLPVIDFGDADNWTPKEDRRWSARYRRLHMILGYVLVPIGLAAFAGIIK